jgi:hypothetical protein
MAGPYLQSNAVESGIWMDEQLAYKWLAAMGWLNGRVGCDLAKLDLFAELMIRGE